MTTVLTSKRRSAPVNRSVQLSRAIKGPRGCGCTFSDIMKRSCALQHSARRWSTHRGHRQGHEERRQPRALGVLAEEVEVDGHRGGKHSRALRDAQAPHDVLQSPASVVRELDARPCRRLDIIAAVQFAMAQIYRIWAWSCGRFPPLLPHHPHTAHQLPRSAGEGADGCWRSHGVTRARRQDAPAPAGRLLGSG